MFSRRLLVASTVVICAYVIAGCGGSSSTSVQTAGGATRTVTLPGATVTQIVPSATSPTSATTTTAGATTGGVTSTDATTTGATRTGTGSGECVAADLKPSFLGTNGAAGTIAVGFALTNSGSSSCTTYGWPGVLLVSSTDEPLPTDAVRTTSDMLGATPATTITLEPGRQVSFRLIASDFASGSTSSCPNASDLQIIAPDDSATMKVAISGGIPACGRATLSPLMVGTSAWPTQ